MPCPKFSLFAPKEGNINTQVFTLEFGFNLGLKCLLSQIILGQAFFKKA